MLLLDPKYQQLSEQQEELHDLDELQKKVASMEPFIRSEIEKINLLMQTFQNIASSMRTTIPLNASEIDEFETLCAFFGSTFRESYPNVSIPPKLHLLESHAPSFMRRFGVLGLFSEDGIERLHNINNKFNRIFHAMRLFKTKEEAKEKRVRSSMAPAAMEAVAEFQQGRKRKFSASTIAIKQQEQNTKVEGKRGKAEELLERAREKMTLDDF